MVAIGVLVPVNPGPLQPPMTRPVGRAALALRKEGITVIFGDRIERRGDEVWMTGQIAIPGAWQTVTQPVQAIHDRYPSQRRARSYAAAMDVAGNFTSWKPNISHHAVPGQAGRQRWLASHGIPMPAFHRIPIMAIPSDTVGIGFQTALRGFGDRGAAGLPRRCPSTHQPRCGSCKQDPTICSGQSPLLLSGQASASVLSASGKLTNHGPYAHQSSDEAPRICGQCRPRCNGASGRRCAVN